MPRKLTKNDNIVYEYLIRNTGAHDIPEISEKVKLSQVKVLLSVQRLLSHGIVRRLNSTYQSL